MKFAYTRRGGPLLDWSGPTPPFQSRAGETRSLGAFYPTNRTSSALRRYGGVSRGHGGAAVGYQHHRSLGAFYPTNRTSSALRRYGGMSPGHGGSAVGYQVSRALGSLNLPRPGAPEVVEGIIHGGMGGYEAPAPGAAIVHLGEDCTWDLAHRRSHGMAGFIPEGSVRSYGVGGFIPEGAARTYGQQMLGDFNVTGDDAPTTTMQTLQDAVANPMVKKASVVASAYHGVKRHNGSVLWGLLWAVGAYVAPINGVSAVALALAQGFGKPK